MKLIYKTKPEKKSSYPLRILISLVLTFGVALTLSTFTDSESVLYGLSAFTGVGSFFLV